MNKYNPNIHHRRSIRLKGYDYSQAGLYYITICCQDRTSLFGEIKNGEMILNAAGKIVEKCWLEIPDHFPNAVLHQYVIMPNHIHGIIELVGANKHSPHITNQHSTDITGQHPINMTDQHLTDNDGNGTKQAGNGAKRAGNGAKDFSPLRSPSKTIGSVVRGFKIGVTKWIRKNTDVHDVWQRNYYENIVRNEKSYQRISEYIRNNPTKWSDDTFYKK